MFYLRVFYEPSEGQLYTKKFTVLAYAAGIFARCSGAKLSRLARLSTTEDFPNFAHPRES